ncbi:FAD-dependent oxidoreductase [Xanthovirga aplysinae]|uniref:FAD-dependent oxidoreductase n=1 Tax=Xanthovirga aplysinae TaxID=2529853 RepID=UPI0012BC1794|nr:FAD-dependent monooxygenase [Xanthovirga aplysinae]MTI32559.1 hypothetical protein [Xanthovirga aplysinae]
MSSDSPEVLIVGAGPTGLSLALQLHRYKIAFRIIDQKKGPSTESRAFGIHARTLEIFDQLGVIKEILREGQSLKGFNYKTVKRTIHFSAEGLIQSKYGFIWILAQSKIESILAAKLSEYGIEVEWEHQLEAFHEKNNVIHCQLNRGDGEGEEENVHYLIGCDGAHSKVREGAGIRFSGGTYPNFWLLADCFIDWEKKIDGGLIRFDAQGLTGFIPLGEHLGRLMFELPAVKTFEDLPKPDLNLVRKVMVERGFKALKVNCDEWITFFKLHHKVASHFQKGNIFIAGDAAHIHSPIGALGMNTGIQDVANLAWKLSLVLKEKAPRKLLESYNSERKKVGANVVKFTDMLMRFFRSSNPYLIWLKEYVLPFFLEKKVVRKRFFNKLSGINIDYSGSPIVNDRWLTSSWKKVDYRVKAGQRIDNYQFKPLHFEKCIYLFDLLKSENHQLLLLSGCPDERLDLVKLKNIYRLWMDEYRDVIDVHFIFHEQYALNSIEYKTSIFIDYENKLHSAFECEKPGLILIRPDGYIGFRSHPVDQSYLEEYLFDIFKM